MRTGLGLGYPFLHQFGPWVLPAVSDWFPSPDPNSTVGNVRNVVSEVMPRLVIWSYE